MKFKTVGEENITSSMLFGISLCREKILQENMKKLQKEKNGEEILNSKGYGCLGQLYAGRTRPPSLEKSLLFI